MEVILGVNSVYIYFGNWLSSFTVIFKIILFYFNCSEAVNFGTYKSKGINSKSCD